MQCPTYSIYCSLQVLLLATKSSTHLSNDTLQTTHFQTLTMFPLSNITNAHTRTNKRTHTHTHTLIYTPCFTLCGPTSSSPARGYSGCPGRRPNRRFPPLPSNPFTFRHQSDTRRRPVWDDAQSKAAVLQFCRMWSSTR